MIMDWHPVKVQQADQPTCTLHGNPSLHLYPLVPASAGPLHSMTVKPHPVDDYAAHPALP